MVSARQFQIGKAVQELGARGDDALAGLGRPLAAQRAVVPAALADRLGSAVTT